MESGMTGLWLNLTPVLTNCFEIKEKLECSWTIIFQVNFYVSSKFPLMKEHMLLFTWLRQIIMRMIVFYLRDWSSKSWQNNNRIVHPILYVVNVDYFGHPILAIEDYTAMELTDNDCEAMITIVLPFTKGWPNKFMSSYQRWTIN